MSGYLGPIVTGGSSGGGAGGTEVFRWNYTDTSQFDTTAVFADGGAVGTMSVVATSGGNALRLTTSAGTTGHIAWLANDPIAFPDTRRDLLFELWIADITPGGGGYGGVVVLADNAGTYHAINHLVSGTAEWGSRVDAGTRLTAGTTGTGTGSDGGVARLTVRGNKPAAAAPFMSSWLESSSTTLITGSLRRSGAALGGTRTFGNGTALAASWNSLACDRWGLCLQSSGGNPMPTDYDILDLRVYLIASA